MTEVKSQLCITNHRLLCLPQSCLSGGSATLSLPLQVNGGDIEDHALKPKDHEEALGEWAVPNALSINASLQTSKHTHTQNQPSDNNNNHNQPPVIGHSVLT